MATPSETGSPSAPSVDRWAEGLARLEAECSAAADADARGEIPGLLLRKGELHLRLDDTAAACADFARALFAAQSASNAAARAAALNGLGRIHYRTGDIAAARQALHAALAAAPETAEPLQAAIRQNLGIAASAAGALDAARLFWLDALSRFAAINSAAGLARVYNNLGVNAMARGEWPESESYLRQALAAAQAAGGEDTVRSVRLNLAAHALAQGDLDTALDELARAASPDAEALPPAAATMPIGLRLLEAASDPCAPDGASA